MAGGERPTPGGRRPEPRPSPRWNGSAALVVLLLAALVLFTARMGDLSLPSLEDAFYGREAVEMARSGRVYTVTGTGAHAPAPAAPSLAGRPDLRRPRRARPRGAPSHGAPRARHAAPHVADRRAHARPRGGRGRSRVPPRDADLRRQRAPPDDGGPADVLDRGDRVGVPRGAGSAPVAARAGAALWAPRS